MQLGVERTSPRDGKPTALWNKIGQDEVSDALIDTNSDGPVTRMCDRT